MCIFTEDVELVEDTRIFARQEMKRQVIVYDMYLETAIETAMVLPILVSNSSGKDVIEFIDLSNYPDFFDEVERLFPQCASASIGENQSEQTIEVQEVRAYEASFVPSPADFKFLDPRFSLNSSFFEKIPEYSNYGFVVFKLKPGKMKVHPMAFWFPKESSDKLFFPTKHMHDGAVHKTEEFSHTLYFQGETVNNSDLEELNAIDCTNDLSTISKKSFGILSKNHNINKQLVYGKQKNSDIWLGIK